MSTGETNISDTSGLRVWAGFTAMELLVGITLTVMLALGVGPLVISVQSAGVREGDRTIAVMQARVATARFERDLRMATCAETPFESSGPVLQALPRQVVFLTRNTENGNLCMVEWELVGSSLMRRWGVCPTARPTSFAHSVYLDSKTMLEGVGNDTRFAYSTGGLSYTSTVSALDLCRICVVSLVGSGVDRDGGWRFLLDAKARVAR